MPDKTESKWLVHFEMNDKGEKQLCRAENFIAYSESLRSLCAHDDSCILTITSALFKEKAVLFKEKINFKLPGGAGFACHQDTPAYIGLAQNHISVLIAVDACTILNGCLQVAAGQWSAGMVPLTADGTVTPEAEAGMVFQHVECEPGDAVFFSGYLPHRSESNRSEASRRAVFVTYNPLREGDLHDEYYAAKHRGMHGFSSAKAISFQNDFLGTIVD